MQRNVGGSRQRRILFWTLMRQRVFATAQKLPPLRLHQPLTFTCINLIYHTLTSYIEPSLKYTIDHSDCHFICTHLQAFTSPIIRAVRRHRSSHHGRSGRFASQQRHVTLHNPVLSSTWQIASLSDLGLAATAGGRQSQHKRDGLLSLAIGDEAPTRISCFRSKALETATPKAQQSFNMT